MLKLCIKCNQEKPLNQFAIASSGKHNFHNFKKTYRNECKPCTAALARKWRKKNPGYRGSGKLLDIPKKDKLLHSAISARLTQARARCKKGKLPYNLTKDFVVNLFKQQKGICIYSGVLLSLTPKTPITLSLDKIIPEKGYVKGNVQWVCWAVNRAKGDMFPEEFLDMCKKITIRCNDYSERK